MRKITALSLALLTSVSLSTAALAQQENETESTATADSSEPNSANDFSQALFAMGGTGGLPSNFSNIADASSVQVVEVSGMMNFDQAGLDAAVAANQSNIDALRAQLAANPEIAGMVDVNTVVGATVGGDGQVILYVYDQMAAAVPMQDGTTTGAIPGDDVPGGQHTAEPGASQSGSINVDDATSELNPDTNEGVTPDNDPDQDAQ